MLQPIRFCNLPDLPKSVEQEEEEVLEELEGWVVKRFMDCWKTMPLTGNDQGFAKLTMDEWMDG